MNFRLKCLHWEIPHGRGAMPTSSDQTPWLPMCLRRWARARASRLTRALTPSSAAGRTWPRLGTSSPTLPRYRAHPPGPQSPRRAVLLCPPMRPYPVQPRIGLAERLAAVDKDVQRAGRAAVLERLSDDPAPRCAAVSPPSLLRLLASYGPSPITYGLDPATLGLNPAVSGDGDMCCRVCSARHHRPKRLRIDTRVRTECWGVQALANGNAALFCGVGIEGCEAQTGSLQTNCNAGIADNRAGAIKRGPSKHKRPAANSLLRNASCGWGEPCTD